MRNLLALVGLATVTFLGLGWYLGWYKIERPSHSPSGTTQVNLNTSKITNDVKSGLDKVQQFISSAATSNNNQNGMQPVNPANNNVNLTPNPSNPNQPANTINWRPIK